MNETCDRCGCQSEDTQLIDLFGDVRACLCRTCEPVVATAILQMPEFRQDSMLIAEQQYLLAVAQGGKSCVTDLNRIRELAGMRVSLAIQAHVKVRAMLEKIPSFGIEESLP